MSKATVDLGRVAVSEFVDAWLDAEAKATGSNKQDVLRKVLGDWALKRRHAYKVYARHLKVKGTQMELDVFETEDDESPSK